MKKSVHHFKNTLPLWLILLCGTAYAQSTAEILQKRYDQAVLDSAIRYEYLKPIAYNLQLENKHLIQENLALRIKNDLKDQDAALAARAFKIQLEAIRQKGNRRFWTGAGIGALGTLIILKL